MSRRNPAVRRLFACAGLLFSVVCLARPSPAQSRYTLVRLGGAYRDTRGFSNSFATGLNNKGEVVGHVEPYDASYNGQGRYACLFADGLLTPLTVFGTNADGLPYSEATAINDNGQITARAYYYDANHTSQGYGYFLYSDARLFNVGYFGITPFVDEYDPAPLKLNNQGQVVGALDTVGSNGYSDGSAGFLYDNGVLTRLMPAELAGNRRLLGFANGINNRGQVVGSYPHLNAYGENKGSIAFLYQNGTFQRLVDFGADPYGNISSTAQAINDLGQIVVAGTRYDANHRVIEDASYLYDKGSLTPVGNLGTDANGRGGGYATALNNRSETVGRASLYTVRHRFLGYRAFRAYNGSMTDLNTLVPQYAGLTLDIATGINDRGQISANALHDGVTEAVRLDPVRFKSDFDGDGQPDILWQNRATGSVGVWKMNGLVYDHYLPIADNIPNVWKVVATPDLNGDGKPDLVWQNTDTGQIAYWFLDGTKLSGQGILSAGVTRGWEIVGSGDVDQDGHDDLLWRNISTGAVAVWYLSGATYLSNDVLSISVSAPANVYGVADLDNNGTPDLITGGSGNDSLHAVLLDSITPQSVLPIAATPAPTWQLGALADFEGTGQTEFIWHNNATGDVYGWRLNGTAFDIAIPIAAGVGSGWEIVGPR